MRYLIFLVILAISPQFVLAQTQETTVKASAGDYYLTISGIVSPNASIVMTSQNVFLASTTADSKGNFTISDVFVVKGFSSFCLQAIDFKKAGNSYTCLNIPAVKKNMAHGGIFLPPTTGVSARKINEDSFTTVFGYTMPGAFVKIDITGKHTLQTKADSTGYYTIKVNNLEPGSYSMSSTATLEQKKSEEPTRKVIVESINVMSRTEFLLRVLVILLALVIPLFILVILFKRRKKKKAKKTSYVRRGR